MEIFTKGSDVAVTIEDIENGVFLTDFEREILLMFQKLVKPGFAVEYCRADESSTSETKATEEVCAIAAYSILFCGTEKCPFAVPITVIVMTRDDPETKISEIIYVANGAISIFFDTVKVVERLGVKSADVVAWKEENPETNIDEVICAAKEAPSTFFDAVEAVRRQNEE